MPLTLENQEATAIALRKSQRLLHFAGSRDKRWLGWLRSADWIARMTLIENFLRVGIIREMLPECEHDSWPRNKSAFLPEYQSKGATLTARLP